MMIPKVYPVAERLTLRACKTDQLKAGMLSVSAVLPIQKNAAYLTSLLLSVLRRGTERYPTLAEINRRLDTLYGTELSIRNFYRGDLQVIGFSAELLDNRYLPADAESLLDGALEVIRQIWFHPCLDADGRLLEKYVEQEKKLQCDQIRAAKNHPRSYAAERLQELLYANEPCGIAVYGTEEEVMQVTSERLTAHWKQLLRDLSLDCFYVGPASATAVSASLKQILQPELSSANAVPFPPSAVLMPTDSVRRVQEELPVAQTQLTFGLRCGITIRDRDFYAAAVYNELLGGSPISKLFMNVREKEGLCYHCSSVYNIYKGTFFLSCGLKNENRMRAETAVLAQLDAISQGNFSEEELSAARKSLQNSYQLIEDSPSAIESYYFGRALLSVRDSLAHCRSCFSKVTREDVIRVAERVRTEVIFCLIGTAEQEEEDDCDLD